MGNTTKSILIGTLALTVFAAEGNSQERWETLESRATVVEESGGSRGAFPVEWQLEYEAAKTSLQLQQLNLEMSKLREIQQEMAEELRKLEEGR